MKHTAGPWKAAIEALCSEGGARCVSVFSLGEPEADIRPATAHGDNDEQAIANAHLIAAAPDMLKALEMLIRKDVQECEILWGQAVIDAETVIKQAKGEK